MVRTTEACKPRQSKTRPAGPEHTAETQEDIEIPSIAKSMILMIKVVTVGASLSKDQK